jgi:hypothetical protein
MLVGTSAWFVALVIQLAISAQSSSIYISLVGIGLGILGTGYILRGMRREQKRKKRLS